MISQKSKSKVLKQIAISASHYYSLVHGTMIKTNLTKKGKKNFKSVKILMNLLIYLHRLIS